MQIGVVDNFKIQNIAINTCHCQEFHEMVINVK